jgi:hypothetical protein
MSQPSPLAGSATTPPVVTTFRDSGYLYSPTVWRGYWGSRIAYALWVLYDALADAAGYAVYFGLPSWASPDSLPWIAKDRQIFQGPNEPFAAYVVRCQQWLDLWRHAGSSTGLLLAIRSTVAPLLPKICTVQSPSSQYAVWDTYQSGDVPFPAGAQNPTPPAHSVVSGGTNWLWDSLSQPFYAPWMYWRTWVILYSAPGDANAPFAVPSKTWATGGTLTLSVVADATYGTKYVNGGTPATPGTGPSWGDGSCWGWAGTAQQAASLTQLAKQWKSAGAWVPWIVVNYVSAEFDQTKPFGDASLPPGTWGYYGQVVADATYGTKYVSARPPCTTCTFVTGTNDAIDPLNPLGVG